MSEEYLKILNDCLFKTWGFLLIPVAVFVLIMIFYLANGIRKKEIKTKPLLLSAFAIFFVLISGAFYTAPVYADIRDATVECASYAFAYNNDCEKCFKNTVFFETCDGTRMKLKNSKRCFPYETKNGKVVYAKHSKILLEYSGTVEKGKRCFRS